MSARSFSTEGRALRAGSPQRLSPQLYPQIKKKKEEKNPQHSHHSHLQPSCAYYYYFRNNLFNKNSCVSSPLPRVLGSPLPFNNNLNNKNYRRAGQSAAAFSCLGSLELRISFPQEGGAKRGVTAGAREGVRPCCPLVGLRHGPEGRAPWLLPRCREEGGRGRGPGRPDRLERRPGVPDLSATAGLRSLKRGRGIQWYPSRVHPAGWGCGMEWGCGEPYS